MGKRKNLQWLQNWAVLIISTLAIPVKLHHFQMGFHVVQYRCTHPNYVAMLPFTLASGPQIDSLKDFRLTIFEGENRNKNELDDKGTG
jgi:hypothetical protein